MKKYKEDILFFSVHTLRKTTASFTENIEEFFIFLYEGSSSLYKKTGLMPTF